MIYAWLLSILLFIYSKDHQMKNLSLVAAALLPTVLATAIHAQTASTQAADTTTASAQLNSSLVSRKRVEIVRTQLSPKLDGVLDDEIWQMATVIKDVHQFSPVDQGVP